MVDSREIPTDPLNVLKAALSDPKLDIDFVGPPNQEQIANAIAYQPRDAYISEWQHREGGIQFEYHVHTNGIRKPIMELYQKGIRGGNPRLNHIYTIPELERIIQHA